MNLKAQGAADTQRVAVLVVRVVTCCPNPVLHFVLFETLVLHCVPKQLYIGV